MHSPSAQTELLSLTELGKYLFCTTLYRLRLTYIAAADLEDETKSTGMGENMEFHWLDYFDILRAEYIHVSTQVLRYNRVTN